MADIVLSENDIVLKQANRLIESIYKMDVNEHKLLLLATKKVNEMELRNEHFDERTIITITGAEFAKQYGITTPSAFKILVTAKKSIYDREFDYLHIDPKTGKVKPMHSRWFQARGENEGKSEINFMFTSAVVPLIYLVEKEYTMLDLQEIVKLKSKYAIRLYKFLMRWVNAPYRNKIPIEKLRDIFGVEGDEYVNMCDFKKRVLDAAVKQVRAGTGFKDLTVKNHKEGVKIVAFSFHYTKYDNQLIKNSKKQVIESSIDPDKKPDEYVIYRMTDEQITAFAPAIAAKASAGEAGFSVIGAMADTGMKAEGLAKLIEGGFRKGVFAPYLDVLKILGFKPTKFNKTPPVSSTSENTPTDSGIESSEGEGTKQNPFKLPDSLYAKYVAKGGKLTRDQILEVAMAENVKPVKVMLDNGINVMAA